MFVRDLIDQLSKAPKDAMAYAFDPDTGQHEPITLLYVCPGNPAAHVLPMVQMETDERTDDAPEILAKAQGDQPEIIDTVRAHLIEGGFTGLIAPDAECGCELSDLNPCGRSFSNCRPGYRHADPRPDNQGGWAIFLKPEPPTDEQWDGVEY